MLEIVFSFAIAMEFQKPATRFLELSQTKLIEKKTKSASNRQDKQISLWVNNAFDADQLDVDIKLKRWKKYQKIGEIQIRIDEKQGNIWLNWIGIDPQYEGKGYAGAAMDALLQFFQENKELYKDASQWMLEDYSEGKNYLYTTRGFKEFDPIMPSSMKRPRYLF